MKNSFRIGLMAIVIGISVIACDPPKTKQESTPADSNKTAVDTVQKTTDTAKNAGTDALKKDTLKK